MDNFSKSLRTAALIVSLLIGSLAGSAQDLNLRKLDAYIKAAMVDHDIPGLAIGIVKDGAVVYQKGYGVKSELEGGAITTNTMFGIASLSKAFTAAAVGKLVDQGLVEWDDPVKKHLPNWKLYDDYVSDHFTVRDLLCHRSGYKTFDGDLLWYGTNYSRAEILSRFQHLPPTYEFRYQYGYQNIMFIAAGELIPAVTGKSWDEFVDQELFDNIGMRASNTSITSYQENQDIALPHVKGQNQKGKQNALMNYDSFGGAAAINSNVVDMTRWIRCWLNEGIANKDTVLSMSTIRNASQLHTPLRTHQSEIEFGTNYKGYGLGWFLQDYKGKRVMHHGGGLPGYISKIAMVPEMEMGFIILTNGESNLPSSMMYYIIDMFMGDEPKDWCGNARENYLKYYASLDAKREKKIAERKADSLAVIPMDSLLGTYTDKMYGTSSLTKVGKKKKQAYVLQLDPAKQMFVSKLEHWQGDSYRIQWKDDFLPWGIMTFKKENGKLGYTIDLPNPDFHFFNLNFVKN